MCERQEALRLSEEASRAAQGRGRHAREVDREEGTQGSASQREARKVAQARGRHAR